MSSTRPAWAKFIVKKRSGYKGYLKDVRSKVIILDRSKFGIPVLPDQKASPTFPEGFFTAYLVTDETSVSLMVRKDNLYVVGFKPKNSDKYFEFKENGKEKLIPHSKELHFSGNYHDLTNVAALSFDMHSIKKAVNILGEYNDNSDDEEAKKSLVTLIVAVCEAARLESVAKFVSKQMWSSKPKTLGSHKLDELMLSWATLSRKVLDLYVPPTNEDVQILKHELKLVKPPSQKDRYTFPELKLVKPPSQKDRYNAPKDNLMLPAPMDI